SFNRISYNANSIPKDKATKNYENLIDPALTPTCARKLTIPAYTHWLVRVSSMWGKEKVLAYAKKLATLAGGRLRQAEEERIVSGEFPIMASTGALWNRCGSGKPRARRLWDYPARCRRPVPTTNWACRKIPPTPIWPNCS